MSDLVNRLRATPNWTRIEHENSRRLFSDHAPFEAADALEAQAARIAELEAALRQIEADCDADYPPSTGAIKYAARAALEGGKE